MSGLAFFDTNVVLYADDVSDPSKQSKAIALLAEHLREGTAVVSLQVLQEYFAAATRKLGMAPAQAQRKIELLAYAKVVRFEANDVIAAIEFHRLSQISFWDALIVHAARLAGASVLYTEDLQHNRVLSGVRIVNPFAQ